MAKFPLYQWKKAGGGSSSIDTQNFASKIKANTFTAKNVFKNTGDVLTIQRTDNQSFGIDFKNEADQRLAYIGTSQNETGKATVWGINGLKLQTTNNLIELNSGTGDCKWESNRNWNQHTDRTLVRTQDLKYVRGWEWTTNVHQADNNWDLTSWHWQMNGINDNGIHEFIICISAADDTLFTFNPKIMWKTGLNKSLSSKFILDKADGGTIEFIFAIHNDNKLYMYLKNGSGNITISWARGWVMRAGNQPWKTDTLW